jgi:hypothetical protein
MKAVVDGINTTTAFTSIVVKRHLWNPVNATTVVTFQQIALMK